MTDARAALVAMLAVHDGLIAMGLARALAEGNLEATHEWIALKRLHEELRDAVIADDQEAARFAFTRYRDLAECMRVTAR